jgi:hypothetical protein
MPMLISAAKTGSSEDRFTRASNKKGLLSTSRPRRSSLYNSSVQKVLAQRNLNERIIICKNTNINANGILTSSSRQKNRPPVSTFGPTMKNCLLSCESPSCAEAARSPASASQIFQPATSPAPNASSARSPTSAPRWRWVPFSCLKKCQTID